MDSGHPQDERKKRRAIVQERRAALTAALGRVLRNDRLAQAACAVFFLAIVLRVAPILSAEGRALVSSRFAPFAFLVLVLVSFRSGLSQLDPHERRFWNDLTLAYGFWLVVASTFLFYPQAEKPYAVRVLSEVLFTFYYIALILAIERQPHHRSRWRSRRLERALTWPSVVFFIAAFLLYFTLVPLRFDREEYDSYVSTMCMYLGLDLLVLIKLVYSSQTAGSYRWKVVYGFLAGAFGVTLLTDFVETLDALGRVANVWPASWSFFWEASYVCLVLAARLRHERLVPGEDRLSEDRVEGGLSGPSGQTMISALAFPFVHFAAYALGFLGEPSKATRESLVGWSVVVLGAVAYLQHRLLERRTFSRWEEHARAVEQLRPSEKDLRLMIERRYGEKLLGASEERFLKVVSASPMGIAAVSLVDGQVVEANPSCERISGYSRDEILGRAPREVGFPQLPEDDALRVLLSRRPLPRELETELQPKSGRPRLVRVSLERIELRSEPCLLATFDDITERRRAEDEVRRRVAAVENARDALFVLDPDARVCLWNESAEALYGIPAEDALGRSPEELFPGGLEPGLRELRRHLEERGTWSGELRLRTRSGHLLRLASRFLHLEDEDGTRRSTLLLASRLDG